ncbi:MAG: mucin9, partial [Verrucomicrobiota bacterium]
MTRIQYAFRGGPGGEPFCHYPNPQPVPGSGPALPFAPFPIEQELSGETGLMVAKLFLPCNGTAETGTRTEERGAGGTRKFYYGTSGGLEPGATFEEVPNGPDNWYPPEANPGGGVHGYNAGFELTRLTEFSDNPATAPSDFQHNYMWHPWRIFDARGTLVQYTYQPSSQDPNQLDGSSNIKEIWYRGSDNSKHTFNWVDPTPGSTERDAVRLPNTFNHWLFGQTDERSRATTYVRDSLRRLIRTNYYDGPVDGNPVAVEEFTYNVLNQVETHTLPSGAVRHYEHDASGLLHREWNSVDGEGAVQEYFYQPGDPDRVWRMLDGRARTEGKSFSVEMTYNKRHQITAVHYPSTGGVADPHISYEYDAYGNCTAITNELGQRSEYAYDSYRRCISSTEPLNAPDWKGTGTVPFRTWNWYYDRFSDSTGMRDASTHTSSQWRVQVEPAFNALGDRRLSAHKFDFNGRIIEEATGLVERASGAWEATDDTEIGDYIYDENGNKKSYTDPLQRVTTYEYDKRNRCTKTTETINTLPRITLTEYDVTGNRTKVTFPDTRTQRWENYDPFGQPRQ